MSPINRPFRIAAFVFSLAAMAAVLPAQERLLIVDFDRGGLGGDLLLAEDNFDLIREESMMANLRHDISGGIVHRPPAEVEK